MDKINNDHFVLFHISNFPLIFRNKMFIADQCYQHEYRMRLSNCSYQLIVTFDKHIFIVRSRNGHGTVSDRMFTNNETIV